MHQCADNRVEDARDRQHDGNKVERHGKGQVALDDPHHVPRQPQQVRQLVNFVIDQRNVRGIDRDVAAHAAHRDTHIRLFECGCVVDAVTDHAHLRPVLLGCVDVIQFVLGQALCPHLVQPQCGRDMRSGIFVVTRQQHRLHARLLHLRDGIRRVRAQRVGQRDQTGKRAVHRQPDHRAALVQILRRTCLRLCAARNMVFLHHLRIARQDGFARHHSLYAAAGQHAEILRRQQVAALRAETAHDRFAQRVLRALLSGCRPGVQRLFLRILRQTAHRNHLRRAEGQGAGLVKGDFCHTRQPLERIALAHEKTVPGCVADRGHDRGRRRQHKRARAEHDQNGHRADDLARDQPGQQRGGQGNHHNPGRPPVRDAHDLGLARVRGLHQADHALDRAVLAHARRPHIKRAELIDRAARHLVSLALIHGQGLAGHHRLVDRGLSGGDHAIHRHGLARQHAQQVAHLHLLGRDDGLSVRPQHTRGARRQMHELFNARPGPRDGQILQQRTQLHDERHLTCGKVLADDHRGDQRDGNQYVRLDVERGHQPDDRLEDDRHAAQDDCNPRRVERQRQQAENARQQRQAADHETGYIFFRPAPFEKCFQLFHG